jgi:hypothetical protein
MILQRISRIRVAPLGAPYPTDMLSRSRGNGACQQRHPVGSWHAPSEARYMPEAFGPVAHLSITTTIGSMDIYLVNSGAWDFRKPARPVRSALYRNNRDGTFTGQSGVRRITHPSATLPLRNAAT